MAFGRGFDSPQLHQNRLRREPEVNKGSKSISDLEPFSRRIRVRAGSARPGIAQRRTVAGEALWRHTREDVGKFCGQCAAFVTLHGHVLRMQ